MLTPVVMTSNGPVQGIMEGTMCAFKGVPYAKAPRWLPPEKPNAWKETFDATHFGPRAIQRYEVRYHDQAEYSEDCLNLCVWTPACDDKKRPVVVYIHGGGHFEGSNSDFPFDGQHLIGSHEAVMVSINYRLGVLGYLYVADILGEKYASSGNCGLLDQIFALKWVQENISAFGGDPDCVTIMGQSAGGKSVSHLLITPLAKGLFHRAIVQSGGVQCVRDLHTASVIAQYHYAAWNVGPGDGDKLLALSSQELLAAQNNTCDHFLGAWHAYGPVADGVVFDRVPAESTYVNNCPVMIGYTSEELYSPEDDPKQNMDSAYHRFVTNYGLNAPLAERMMKNYEDEPFSCRIGRAASDCTYHAGGEYMMQRLAKAGCPVYAYLWDYFGRDRPHHFSEMRFLFRYSLQEDRDGYGEGEESEAEKMNRIWMSFIKTGDPRTDAVPVWPFYTVDHPVRVRFMKNKDEVQEIHYHFDYPEQVVRY